jgi:hypothetical protein
MSDSELLTENLEILVLYTPNLQVSHWQELGPAKAASQNFARTPPALVLSFSKFGSCFDDAQFLAPLMCSY